MARIPKVIRLVLHKGYGLSYVVPGTTQNNDSKKWKAKFIGATKKFESCLVSCPDGNPEWNTEVKLEMDSKNPIIIRIMDALKRHIGQVTIPLDTIVAKDDFDLKPIFLREENLQPTKGNKYPMGKISFWVHPEEFWPENTNLTRSISLSTSLSNLNSFFRSKGDNVSEASFSLSTKFRNLKKKTRQREASIVSGSMVSGYTKNGVSRNSSFMSNGRSNGWNETPNAFTANTYDPMEGGNPTESQQNSKKSALSNLSKIVSRSTHNLFDKPFKTSRKNSETDLQSHGTKDELQQSNGQKKFEFIKTTPMAKVKGYFGHTTSRNMADVPPLGESPKISRATPDFHNTEELLNGTSSGNKPPKPISELNRREIMAYMQVLETKNRNLKDENVTLKRRNDDLSREIEETNQALNDAREDLLIIKNRLLNDGMTKYLEVQSKSETEVRSRDSPFDSKSTGYYSGLNKSLTAQVSPVKQQENPSSPPNNFLSGLGSLSIAELNQAISEKVSNGIDHSQRFVSSFLENINEVNEFDT